MLAGWKLVRIVVDSLSKQESKRLALKFLGKKTEGLLLGSCEKGPHTSLGMHCNVCWQNDTPRCRPALHV